MSLGIANSMAKYSPVSAQEPQSFDQPFCPLPSERVSLGVLAPSVGVSSPSPFASPPSLGRKSHA
eukprot:6680239-Karenia_brevis.AAC.1